MAGLPAGVSGRLEIATGTGSSSRSAGPAGGSWMLLMSGLSTRVAGAGATAAAGLR